jgi:cytochrome c biogenesis protein CcmG/thiol:disulfide interchange protein DsbE
MKRIAFFTAVFMLLLAGVLYVASAAERVPNFKLEGVDGKTYELKEVAKDAKAILIDFWEVNCKPCKKLMPHLQTYCEVYGPAGLKVLVISRDTTITISKVKPFVASEKWTFPVLYDPDHKVSQALNVKFAPVTFVLNNKGEIQYQHSGFKPGQEKELEDAIVKALGLSEKEVKELYAKHAAKSEGE